MISNLKLQLLLLMVIVAAVVGCPREPQPPLRIGTNVWPGYEPLYLARELGYVNKTSVKLVEYPSSSEVMRSFQNNTIDAAALTLDETLQLLAAGSDIKVILIMDISSGGDVILARPGIRSVKDLRNRRVGFESTALGAYVLTRALQLARMKPSDVKTVPLDLAEHEIDFRDGRVDAIVTFEPIRTRLLAAGARQIFDSSRIPGEIMDVLVVRSDFAKKYPEQVRNVMVSWFKALDYMSKNQRPAAEIMAMRERITAEEFLMAQKGLRYPELKENHTMLAGESPSVLASAQRISAVMFENKLIDRAPDIRPALDGAYLRELAP